MAKQAVRKKMDDSWMSGAFSSRLREAMSILLFAVALLLFMSLSTYQSIDPGWTFTGTEQPILNKGGRIGAWFADVFLTLFGFLAYLFPLMILYFGWRTLVNRQHQFEFSYTPFVLKIIGAVMTLLSGTGLASLHFDPIDLELPVSAGGILGNAIGFGMVSGFNLLGTTLVLFALFLIGITLLTGLSWLILMDRIGQLVFKGAGGLVDVVGRVYDYLGDLWAGFLTVRKKEKHRVSPPNLTKNKAVLPASTNPIAQELPLTKVAINQPNVAEKKKGSRFAKRSSELPQMSLLDNPSKRNSPKISTKLLEDISRMLEIKLKDFGVEARVVEVLPGPVVTRYELLLAPGLKVSKVTNLSKDLARSLSVTRVRVVEVIPGKSVIGIELPNNDREIVRLREVLESQAYLDSRSLLTLALGKDIAGFPVVVDLAKMPHLLVAGTTGSGKSVGLNVMLLSLLFKATPDEVRLIMIDPKMLELSIYEGIPHLLTPVVTDMTDAANALRWCVAEMELRYQMMAALGVRNITGFNNAVRQANKKGEPLFNPLRSAEDGREPEPLEPFPFIVVVIDELADMMMVVGKKVEQLIARIAQKARAAGIHLILATQRPSVDVLTGLIKANIPTRMAFQVSSKVDSRTILDQQGAENLLGHGDMLYLPPGSGLPSRVHGAFVDDHEVHNVVEALRQQGEPDYCESVLEGGDIQSLREGDPLAQELKGSEDSDPLYDEAVYIVTKSRRASISSIQRRLKIGYNRAARIIEDMEKAGVVSEMQTNGAREVLAPPPPE